MEVTRSAASAATRATTAADARRPRLARFRSRTTSARAHSRNRARSLVVRLLAAGFAASACATAVEVAPAPQADDPACAQAAAHWPATVGPHERAATTAQSPAVAAWGDPAIIARCGVTSPGPTTNDCISVDGIDWVALPLDDGTRFVSYGRAPAIEVLVPRAYDPAPLVLGAFSSAAGTISQGLHRCR